jgi:hypothetical protein
VAFIELPLFIYAVYHTLEITKEDMKITFNKDTNKTINKRFSSHGIHGKVVAVVGEL